MAVELWGKARSYLESSLAMEPRPAAYALYGQLLRQLGEEDDAAAAFRSGLALVTGPVNELPALGAPHLGTEPEPSGLSAGASGATRANR
jgi:HemY protein